MKRFASLATTAALAGALVGVGSASFAASAVLNMYLVPISPLNATYKPGDNITFAALVDIPANGVGFTTPGPITLTLGASVAYSSSIFDINGLKGIDDTSAYPPKPSVNTWDLTAPNAFSNTATGPDGTAASALDTFQTGVGHTKQVLQPGNKTTTIPGGTYTISTFTFPVLATAASGPASIYLPTAYGFGGPNASKDFINNTDSLGTNNETLAYPNDGITKFSKLTYNVASTPAPSSLLVVAMGALPVAGLLRRRRASK